MLYEPKIRVTRSFRKLLHILMKEFTGSLRDKCNFVLIYSRNAFFAPTGPLADSHEIKGFL